MAGNQALGLGLTLRTHWDLRAAGAGIFGGFDFFEQARATETSGGSKIGWQWKMGELRAPAIAFGMAIEHRAAFGADFLHGNSMA